jgi:hypothetical protein
MSNGLLIFSVFFMVFVVFFMVFVGFYCLLVENFLENVKMGKKNREKAKSN